MDLPEAPPIYRLTPGPYDRGENQEPEVDQNDIELTVLEKMRCQWCGGWHPTNCWAISEVTFLPDGRWASVKLFPRPKLEADTIYDENELQISSTPKD